MMKPTIIRAFIIALSSRSSSSSQLNTDNIDKQYVTTKKHVLQYMFVNWEIHFKSISFINWDLHKSPTQFFFYWTNIKACITVIIEYERVFYKNTSEGTQLILNTLIN